MQIELKWIYYRLSGFQLVKGAVLNDEVYKELKYGYISQKTCILHWKRHELSCLIWKFTHS